MNINLMGIFFAKKIFYSFDKLIFRTGDFYFYNKMKLNEDLFFKITFYRKINHVLRNMTIEIDFYGEVLSHPQDVFFIDNNFIMKKLFCKEAKDCLRLIEVYGEQFS